MTMSKTVHVALYDALADWEVGHAIAFLRDKFAHQRPEETIEVRTVGLDLEPITTMGGMRILPDLTLAQLNPADSAMLILPGSTGWDAQDERLPAFTDKARQFLAAGVPVAAICGATAGMARAGLLDDHDHTSGAAEYLAATGYAGAARYQEVDAVTDGNLITAGPTEPVAFAREVLTKLDVFTPQAQDAWYRLHHDSDPAAFGELFAIHLAGQAA